MLEAEAVQQKKKGELKNPLYVNTQVVEKYVVKTSIGEDKVDCRAIIRVMTLSTSFFSGRLKFSNN